MEDKDMEIEDLSEMLEKTKTRKRSGERTARARDIIRSVLRFTPGEGHYVPCTDQQEQERFRVILMTERKNLEKEDPDIISRVRISKETLEIDLKKICVVKVWRADDIGEDLIKFDKSGNLTVDRVIPEADQFLVSQIKEALMAGLTWEQVGERDDSGGFVLFRGENPTDVKIAIAAMRKEKGLPFEA
jgi:hypothetical protein